MYTEEQRENYSEEKAEDCYVEGYLFAAKSKLKYSEILAQNPYATDYNGYAQEWAMGAKEGCIERSNDPDFPERKSFRAYILFRYGIDLKTTPKV